ncbi:MAG: M20/M25/M40 family metallo-hydrolase [Chitinophagales bacterium]
MSKLVDRDRLVQEFLTLVRIDSPSWEEGAVKVLLVQKLEALGFKVFEDGAGKAINGQAGNLIASLPGNVPGPSYFFCAHMDTVQPGRGIQPVIENDVIRSSGDTVLGGDDKAGISAILEAFRVIIENNIPRPNLEVIFTITEEQGLMGSKLIDFNNVNSIGGFVLDSVGQAGTIVTRGPAQNELEFEVFGKAAHAGINPEDGKSAIALASLAITNLQLGRIDEETTCNLGLIQGGTARNIVPEKVVIRGEARSLDPVKLEELTRNMVTIFEEKVQQGGGSCKSTITPLYHEINLQPTDTVVRIAMQAAEAMGKEVNLTRTGGGSDANLFNQQGLPCANLGIGMTAVHTVDECLSIEDLVDSARWVIEIINKLGEANH